jgi:hypothetical protein
MGRIYIQLKGGLGNQLFQAALGVALTRRLGAEVIYLAESFAADPFGRGLLLDRFPNLPLPIAPHAAIAGVPVMHGQGLDGEGLLALIADLPVVALSGWWQKESFFLGEQAEIRQAFSLRVDTALAQRGDELSASGAIGAHVRRGEYGHFGLVKADYYRSAIAQIQRETGPRPVVFFTDEPQVCWSLFSALPDMRLYRGDVAEPLADFYLLGRCAHFVIANSTFSWWAAWLGRTPSSIVYAPQPWSIMSDHNPVPPDWRQTPDALVHP